MIRTIARDDRPLGAFYKLGGRVLHKCDRCSNEHSVNQYRRHVLCEDCRSLERISRAERMRWMHYDGADVATIAREFGVKPSRVVEALSRAAS